MKKPTISLYQGILAQSWLKKHRKKEPKEIDLNLLRAFQ